MPLGEDSVSLHETLHSVGPVEFLPAASTEKPSETSLAERQTTSIVASVGKDEINPFYMVHETGPVDPHAVWEFDKDWHGWMKTIQDLTTGHVRRKNSQSPSKGLTLSIFSDRTYIAVME